MNDFKDRMVEAVERGWATEAGAYDHVREATLDAADLWLTKAKEAGFMNPLVQPFFCRNCHWTENAHASGNARNLLTGEACHEFVPGDPEQAHEHNARIGFPSR